MKLIRSLLAALSISLTISSSTLADEGSPKGLWEKPVVIGASVSDGYDHREPIGGVESEKLSLEHYLTKLIRVPHGKITNFGNKFYFIRPLGVSEKQVENASKLKPSVVLAPDYLFWLVYGNHGGEKNRMVNLIKGLKLLETFGCPMVVGNIPDASKAVYKMLAPSQIPKFSTMDAANKKIMEWAKTRSNVVILDNKNFMKQSHADEEIKLRYKTIDKGQTRKLLQSDFLHPTKEGAEAVSYAILESLQQHTKFSETDVNWGLRQRVKP